MRFYERFMRDDDLGEVRRVGDPTLSVTPCEHVEDARRLVKAVSGGKCLVEELHHT